MRLFDAGDLRPDAAALDRLPEELAAMWRAEVCRSPADQGTVELIVCRPAKGRRKVLEVGELDVTAGLVGDNWLARGRIGGGPADPRSQLNIMNSRCAELVAGGRERIPEAGDQLFLDLDLSAANMPPGTRLALGTALIEITTKPHTGCVKFTRRFGHAVRRWINGPEERALNLRGVCARVVAGGVVKRGDVVSKVAVD